MDLGSSSDTQQLFVHIGEKGIQTGSIVGTFASTPFAAWRHTRQGGHLDGQFLPKAMKAITGTTVLITGLTLIAGLGLVGFKEGFDADKIGDRVYRLQHNKQQNRCDLFAYGGGVAGAALSCLKGFPAVNTLGGFLSLGTAAGVLLHVATSQEEEGKKVDALKGSVNNVAKELS